MSQPSGFQDLCILVVSCDKYSDCWEPFSVCLEKFWPDCPYPVYLATETKEAPVNTVYKKTLHSTNSSWTGRLREICEHLQESHILLTLEDHWIASNINSKSIHEVLQLIHSTSGIGVVYLDYPVKSQPVWSQNNHYYLIAPGSPYRLAAGPSIWDKKFLMVACAEDVDAWNFERVKSFSEPTYTYTVLACVNSIYCRVHPAGAVQRGKWQSFIPSFAKGNNLSIDLSKRDIMSYKDNFIISLKSFIFNLNPSLIVKIQNWIYHFQHKSN